MSDLFETEVGQSKRAGRYIRQVTGYRAFIPASLPPDNPPLNIDMELQKLLSDADAALGRLDGSIQTLPHPDLFMFMYVRKEAVLSSQIEGTQASLNDVIKAEGNLFSTEKTGDVNEVINYIDAMNYGLQRLKVLPLSVRLIREIHEHLMRGVRGSKMRPGEIRRSQNWIGPKGSTLADAFFVPPPHEEAENALSDLEKFLNGEDNLPLLLKIGLAHAQFETIHPFLDGNGRVGRLLITFFLCSQNILQKPVLYLSYYLKKHQSTYYEKLQKTRDNGEWEEWLKFFLRGVAEVAHQATETARKIVALREEHRQRIVERFAASTGNGLRVLERLYGNPYISVNQVSQITGASFPNANNLIKKFVETGILVEMTGQSRNRVFWYHSYTDLFSNLGD
ncbi:Fic family protein [Ferrovibrio sp.]|uniref:Fic family protein n=1 Tax=Ferrovibrio sp. TaxID=1917215 RepID=UPI0035AE34DB